MQELVYSEEVLIDSEKELRRLIIVGLYGFKDYIRKDLTEEEKEELKQQRELIKKATFVQFGKYKKLYAEKILQEAKNNMQKA